MIYIYIWYMLNQWHIHDINEGRIGILCHTPFCSHCSFFCHPSKLLQLESSCSDKRKYCWRNIMDVVRQQWSCIGPWGMLCVPPVGCGNRKQFNKRLMVKWWSLLVLWTNIQWGPKHNERKPLQSTTWSLITLCDQ